MHRSSCYRLEKQNPAKSY